MNRLTFRIITPAAVLFGLWPTLMIFLLTSAYTTCLRRILA